MGQETINPRDWKARCQLLRLWIFELLQPKWRFEGKIERQRIFIYIQNHAQAFNLDPKDPELLKKFLQALNQVLIEDDFSSIVPTAELENLQEEMKAVEKEIETAEKGIEEKELEKIFPNLTEEIRKNQKELADKIQAEIKALAQTETAGGSILQQEKVTQKLAREIGLQVSSETPYALAGAADFDTEEFKTKITAALEKNLSQASLPVISKTKINQAGRKLSQNLKPEALKIAKIPHQKIFDQPTRAIKIAPEVKKTLGDQAQTELKISQAIKKYEIAPDHPDLPQDIRETILEAIRYEGLDDFNPETVGSWWSRHRQRIEDALARLGFRLPPEEQMIGFIQEVGPEVKQRQFSLETFRPEISPQERERLMAQAQAGQWPAYPLHQPARVWQYLRQRFFSKPVETGLKAVAQQPFTKVEATAFGKVTEEIPLAIETFKKIGLTEAEIVGRLPASLIPPELTARWSLSKVAEGWSVKGIKGALSLKEAGLTAQIPIIKKTFLITDLNLAAKNLSAIEKKFFLKLAKLSSIWPTPEMSLFIGPSIAPAEAISPSLIRSLTGGQFVNLSHLGSAYLGRISAFLEKGAFGQFLKKAGSKLALWLGKKMGFEIGVAAAVGAGALAIPEPISKIIGLVIMVADQIIKKLKEGWDKLKLKIKNFFSKPESSPMLIFGGILFSGVMIIAGVPTPIAIGLGGVPVSAGTANLFSGGGFGTISLAKGFASGVTSFTTTFLIGPMTAPIGLLVASLLGGIFLLTFFVIMTAGGAFVLPLTPSEYLPEPAPPDTVPVIPPPAGMEFRWPVDDPLFCSSNYGYRELVDGCNYHEGIDIPAPGGAIVYPTAEGTISSFGFDDGYGYYVVVKHAENLYSFYAHLIRLDTYFGFKVGDSVEKTDPIGKVDDTGYSFGNHLHFGFSRCGSVPGCFKDGNFTPDPCDYLSEANPACAASCGYRDEAAGCPSP